MATIKYLYRSKLNEAQLKVRMLVSRDGENFTYDANSQIVVEKQIWEKYTDHSKIRDITLINKREDLKLKTASLKSFLLQEMKSVNEIELDKNWLELTISRYYKSGVHSKPDVHTLPQSIVYWAKKYIEYKKPSTSLGTHKKSNVILNYLIKYQNERKDMVYVRDVDFDFANNFRNFLVDDGYAQSTIERALKFCKTIVRYARINGIEVNQQFEAIKVQPPQKKPIIYLNLEEQADIEKLTLSGDEKTARDWLIIGCNLGQRISDLMDMNMSKVRKYKDKYIIEIEQKKTKKRVAIPFNKKAIKILDEYDWNFPPKLEYHVINDLFKVICRKAKIKEPILGTIKKSLGNKKVRGVEGVYPKHKLIGTHVCRRSFASNYYGKAPTSYLKTITGHTSEKDFLGYIGKSETDYAVDLAKYLD